MIFRKVFANSSRARKESKILSFLENSTLKDSVPKSIGLKFRPDGDLELEMSFMHGRSLSVADLTPVFLEEIAEGLRNLHKLGEFSAFGVFDERLTIQNPREVFGEFILDHIHKWRARLPQKDIFLDEYASFLREQIQRSIDCINRCTPIFCHGDLDLKNLLLLNSTPRIGFVDWEHSGVLSLEWELRKLIRYCKDDQVVTPLLQSYFGFNPFDLHERITIIRLFDIIDLLGHAGWCRSLDKRDEYVSTLTQMRCFLESTHRPIIA